MLKKNILCLVMAAVMTFGTVTTAKAEEITSSKDWMVDFKNDKLNSSRRVGKARTGKGNRRRSLWNASW